MTFQALSDDTCFCLLILSHLKLERQRVDTLKKKISKQGEKILTSQMGAPCCISYYLAQKMSGFSRFIQRAETKPDSNKFSLSEFRSWRFS